MKNTQISEGSTEVMTRGIKYSFLRDDYPRGGPNQLFPITAVWELLASVYHRAEQAHPH